MWIAFIVRLYLHFCVSFLKRFLGVFWGVHTVLSISNDFKTDLLVTHKWDLNWYVFTQPLRYGKNISLPYYLPIVDRGKDMDSCFSHGH